MTNIKSKTHEQEILENAGLGENESALYLILLKNPECTVQELQQKSPLPRTMLYYVLNNLVHQGLVTPVKEKWRTIYKTEDPERLYDLLEKKQHEFDQRKTDVRALIPELRQTFRLSTTRPGIRLFEGLDQYRTALDDIFATQADTIYAFVPTINKKNPGVELRTQFEREREDRGIMLRILTKDKITADHIIREHTNKRLLDVKIISTDAEFPDTDIRLYSGRIMYTRYEKHEPLVLIIEDRPLYDFQKALFLNLCKQTQNKK